MLFRSIFPVLPSIITAGDEVKMFIEKGNVNFSDEVTLATAISRVYNTPKPSNEGPELTGVDVPKLRSIIDSINDNGYVSPEIVRDIFSCANIPMAREIVTSDINELLSDAETIGYPIVAKVVGPLHKTDVAGVVLNIHSKEHLKLEFERLMSIDSARAVLIQPMLEGTELFIGAKYEARFGHIILCGLGGIFVEVLKDVASGLAPLSHNEAQSMIRSLRAYKIIKGTRGLKGVNEYKFAEIIVRLSSILRFATEIKELDINQIGRAHV